jgi:hypothetical protein
MGPPSVAASPPPNAAPLQRHAALRFGTEPVHSILDLLAVMRTDAVRGALVRERSPFSDQGLRLRPPFLRVSAPGTFTMAAAR